MITIGIAVSAILVISIFFLAISAITNKVVVADTAASIGTGLMLAGGIAGLASSHSGILATAFIMLIIGLVLLFAHIKVSLD